MSVFRTFLSLLVLATPIVAFSQNTGTKPPESGGTGSQVPPTTATNPCAPEKQIEQQVEILTDTMGVNFGPYMTKVVKTIRQNWYGLIPPSVYSPTFKQGRVAIEFVVQKDGRIDKMMIDTPSGDLQLDRAAWGSITSSSPLPSLPDEFSGPNLRLRLYYFYNLTPDARIYISPCVDVRVPVGSTLQFSVPMDGIEHADVTWSVSGPACEKAACGTISESGLYSAPARVPEPPTVFVKATPRSNRSFPARTQLTVVKESPPH
jgi:TonB family protein